MKQNMTCGLLGEHLGHSFSPAIHSRLADYDYQLYQRTPQELEEFLTNGTFDGMNVTIPYKKSVIPYCAQLSPAAKRIGSVNSLIRQPDGTLLGDNTDYDGFLYLLQSANADVKGKKVLVLGSGGSSLTVCAAMGDLQAGEVVVISRTGPNNYNNLYLHKDAQIVVNTTPVGMYPYNGVSPVDLDCFPMCEGVFDLIYNPARTQLLLEAEKRNIPCANGLGMLVAQAKAAAERFASKTIDDNVVGAITYQMQEETKNLILVGMPGSGKTTIGTALGERLGRPVVDLDSIIVEEAGCSIAEIFAKDGEEAFRALEHEVLCRYSKNSGQVLIPGGGVITRANNIDPLRQNSEVIFLRRDIDLLPTEGRPISQRSNLHELFAQRKPLYESVSHFPIYNDRTVDEVVTDITTRLGLLPADRKML